MCETVSEQREQRAIIKLTDAEGYTGRKCIPPKPLQWGPGVTHAVEYTGALCTAGVLHCYEATGATEHDALRNALALALLRDPNDAHLGETARAWVCDGAGEHVSNGLKSGYETLTTVREIPLPDITTEQRVECAIRIAMEVWDDPAWRAWAAAWLDGSDRTAASARDAAWAARDAAWAAEAAGWAADEGVGVAAIAGAVLLPEWVDSEGGRD
jgi:hypothetical protein